MPATPPRMLPKVKVLRVNGKPFVCGLFWQPLTRPRAYMKEAREIGKRESMEIVAIRRSTIIQAGFVAKHQGALKGMISMAAALPGLLGPSWLGGFVLDDGPGIRARSKAWSAWPPRWRACLGLHGWACLCWTMAIMCSRP